MAVPRRRWPRAIDVLFWAAVACQAGVWVLVTIGGVANTGFRQYEQYLSTLAARGAMAPGWGLAALLLLSVGLFLLVPVLLAWHRFVAVAVLVAAISSVFFASMQVPCPPRARFCTETAVGAFEVPHAGAVVVFSAALLTAVLAGAVQVWRGGERQPRLWPAAVVSVFVVGLASGWLITLTGLPQRMFLMFGQIAILVVASAAHNELGRRERLALKQRAHVPVEISR